MFTPNNFYREGITIDDITIDDNPSYADLSQVGNTEYYYDTDGDGYMIPETDAMFNVVMIFDLMVSERFNGGWMDGYTRTYNKISRALTSHINKTLGTK
jgi:hypothetical protein